MQMWTREDLSRSSPSAAGSQAHTLVKPGFKNVDARGFEPLTSTMST